MAKKDWLKIMIAFVLFIVIMLIPMILFSEMSGNWIPSIVTGGICILLVAVFIICEIVYENKQNKKKNKTECFITPKEIEKLKRDSIRRF